MRGRKNLVLKNLVFRKVFIVIFILSLWGVVSVMALQAEDPPEAKGERQEKIFDTADDQDCNAVPGPRCTCAEYPDRIACEWFGIHPPLSCFWILDCAEYWDPPKQVKQPGESQ